MVPFSRSDCPRPTLHTPRGAPLSLCSIKPIWPSKYTHAVAKSVYHKMLLGSNKTSFFFYNGKKKRTKQTKYNHLTLPLPLYIFAFVCLLSVLSILKETRGSALAVVQCDFRYVQYEMMQTGVKLGASTKWFLVFRRNLHRFAGSCFMKQFYEIICKICFVKQI